MIVLQRHAWSGAAAEPMLTGGARPPALAGLSGRPVRDRLLGRPRADQGRSLIGSPYVYTLSLAVYCTAWTFYGSVGLAARQGLAFLPVYLGPTLAACCCLPAAQDLRITKAHGITSIADFIAARYGKSATLAGLVTIMAVVGVDPLHRAAAQGGGGQRRRGIRRRRPIGRHCCRGVDTALLVALALAAFASCSAPATSTPPSTTRAWCWRSPSRASSSC